MDTSDNKPADGDDAAGNDAGTASVTETDATLAEGGSEDRAGEAEAGPEAGSEAEASDTVDLANEDIDAADAPHDEGDGLEPETVTSAATPAQAEAEVPPTAMEELIDIAKTVAIAVAVTLVFRFFFFQPFNIPSGSMKSTLLVGDFVLVDKMEYGYSKASLIWPLTRLPGDGRLFGSDPDRGDVVVFKNKADRNRDYIKRVIGVAGDTVQVIEGRVYLNGQALQRELATDIAQNCSGDRHNDPDRKFTSAKVYRETIPGGPTYIIQECRGDRGDYENTKRFVVPGGHFFLMGDNRDNSQDSRTDKVGYVPSVQIVGEATRIAFSVDGKASRLWEPWNWPGAIRYGRLFDQVD